MDIKSLRRECIRMTDRTMPINFRLAAARQIEAYILGRDPADREVDLKVVAERAEDDR